MNVAKVEQWMANNERELKIMEKTDTYLINNVMKADRDTKELKN
jgi:hypothetical protein